MRKGQGNVYKGDPQGAKAACTMKMKEADFIKMAARELNPQQAFFSGKLKITGNIMLSQKLSGLFEEESKL